MKINYKDIIMSAANIVWRHKFLWFFGLFAALLSGGGGYGASSGSSGSFASSWQNLKDTGIFDSFIISNIGDIFQRDPVSLFSLVFVLLAFLALAIFILWLAIVSQGALIKSVAKIYSKQTSNFQDGLKSGIEKFWPVFFYKVIEKIIILSVLAIIALPFVLILTGSDNILAQIGFYLLSILLLVLAMVIVFVIRYSMSYNIIKDIDFAKSISDGFNLFKSNILITIETAIIVFIISLVLGFLVLLLLTALIIPFIFLIFLFNKLGFDIFLFTILVAGLIILFAAILVVGGILSAFGDAIWTILFLRLIKEKPTSLIGSLFRKR